MTTKNEEPLFPLGAIVATPGAINALTEADQLPQEFLDRHSAGDWGDLPAEDIKENEFSLENGFRLFSAYHTNKGVKLYVITEHDRSVTTVLLPRDY